MANQTMRTRVMLHNKTVAEWAKEDIVLLRGEIGIEIDTRKFKFGDGAKRYSELKYASSDAMTIVKEVAPTKTDYNEHLGTLWINVTDDTGYILYDNTEGACVWKKIIDQSDLTDFGSDYMLTSKYATIKDGYVDKAVTAEKLETPRTISISDDVIGTVQFDGSSDVVISTVLKNSGVLAGTYTKLTVDAKGIVTSATTLLPEDIPNLTLSKITDAGTVASKDFGTSEGQIPILGSGGKLNTDVIPALAISETKVVQSEAAMLALEAQIGDVAVRTDISKSFILAKEPANTLENWIELLSPPDSVVSVNGKTGIITLATDDIAEGSVNLYFTEERANANFKSNFVKSNSIDLADGPTIVKTSDFILIDGNGIINPSPVTPPSIFTRDPSNVGGDKCNVTIKDNIATVTGEIAWYPEDESLGRAAGNRVGFEIKAPDGVVDTNKSMYVYKGRSGLIKDDTAKDPSKMWWYPLVTSDITNDSIIIDWDGDGPRPQEPFIVNFDNVTLAPGE